MGSLKDLLQLILNRNDFSQMVEPRTKSGKIDMSKSVYAKEYHQHQYFNNGVGSELGKYETITDNDIVIDLKETIIPIEDLINQGKFLLAIQKYEELIGTPQFTLYTKDEKFLIYNGILNCHINSDAREVVINNWKVKIQALGTDIKEIHRFYFLLGIREYNNQLLENALIYINQSLDVKPDYMNAITTEILIKVSKKGLSYEKAQNKLKELLNRKGLGIKDIATIHSSYGDIAFNSKDYSTAQKHYSDSNQLSQSLVKEIGIAVCQYFLSLKEIKEDGRVDLDKIDFNCLKVSESMFAKIYENRTEDTIQTIVRISFSFYFNILALNNDYKTILNIYKETAKHIDNTQTEQLRYVIEAQIFHGILDENTLSLLSEYEQIKYEALYHEKQEDNERVIELLTPVFEGKYKNEKVLQLIYLTALKETDQFERYMQYYQKFCSHEDEVMRMNYIQFLMKKNEKKLVLDEIKKLKLIAKNGFVLYDLLIIYREYQLDVELDEFFKKVETGEYNIIGLQKPFVFYQQMIHLLNKKEYDEYFKLYEMFDLSILKENQRLILKINYFIFKRDLDNLASSYYEYFQYTQNYNELIKAIQIRLQINQCHEAEFYLELVNPMMLDKPEYYYMFKVIILREKKEVEEAFKQLEFVLEFLDIDLESPFHQFYTAFNMNNNRTDVAFRYMGEYYAKNPNPYWFKVIQLSENESGSEIMAKLEEAIGDRRDLTLINQFFINGIIGISTYNMLVGTGIEEILFFKHYPYTRVPISRGNILQTKSIIEIVGEKIIVDATTLTILSAANALSLLDVFSEILIPYTIIKTLTERKAGMFKEYAVKALEYVGQSPRIRRLAVDESMKIKGNAREIIPEDILDCILLAKKLGVTFLNTEVAVDIEFKQNEIIDVNTLFLYTKEIHPEKREAVAETIAKMREMGLEFISFDADDMYNVYRLNGVEAIEPFLRMGKNADYKTFPPTFVNFLVRIYKNYSTEEFEKCSQKIICFMDKYVGKTRYYMSEIVRKFPNVEDSFSKLIQKPSVCEIMFIKTYYNITLRNSIIGCLLFLFQIDS